MASWLKGTPPSRGRAPVLEGLTAVLIRDLSSPQVLDDFKLAPLTGPHLVLIIAVAAVIVFWLSCFVALPSVRATSCCKTRPSSGSPLHSVALAL